jgi:hypothetical protein
MPRDQTNGHVVHRDGQPFGVAEGRENFIAAFVAGQPFFEAILAVIDVAYVNFDMAEAARVASGAKDRAGSFGRRQRAIVLAYQNVRLDGGVERAALLFRVTGRAEDFKSARVEFQRGRVVAAVVKRVGFGAQAAAQGVFVAQLFGDRYGGFSERQRFARVHAEFRTRRFVELLHRSCATQTGAARKKVVPAGVVAKFRHFGKELFRKRKGPAEH